MSSFRILHLSDLHLSPSREWDAGDVLLRAIGVIKRLCDDGLRPDVIAITGDLAATGSAAEYAMLREWIDTHVLDASRGLGFATEDLLCIPGNHDVERNKVSAGARALQDALRSQGTQDEIAGVLSHEHDRKTLLRRHENYLSFVSSLHSTDEEFPWWSRSYVHDGKKISLFGLCSSWMSCGKDDKGRLLIGKYQLSKLGHLADDAEYRIALVHHPIDYLQDFDADYFRDVFPNDFDLVLCGHLHSHSATQHISSDRGYVEIAAGAMYAGGTFPNSFHLIEIDLAERQLRVRPYLWKRQDWVLERNEYSESPDGILRLALPVKSEIDIDILSSGEENEEVQEPTASIVPENFGYQDQPSLLEAPPASSEARKQLSGVPVAPLSFGKHDAGVRQTARAEAETYLRKERVIWLQAAWGVGSKGFLGSLVSRFKSESDPVECFQLQCDDAQTGDDILECFIRQFGMPIQQFARWVGVLPRSFLILADVQPSTVLAKTSEAITLRRIVDILKDYCPNLRVVVHSTATAPADDFPRVELHPLDQLDIKEYLELHPIHPIAIDDLDVLDQILRATGGLPRHLDSVLESLQISGLEEVLSSFAIDQVATDSAVDDIPPSLTSLIGNLSEANDESSRRCYRLLVALSVLDSGEMLSTIKRMFPDAPFWENHAKRLIDLSLLDAIPLTAVGANHRNASSGAVEADKLLRLPRAVRDYVRSMINQNELRSILHAAADVLFGRKWRRGSVRLVKRDAFLEGAFGPGNEHSVCVQMLRNAIQDGDEAEFGILINVALTFCNRLKRTGRFRDGYASSNEILKVISSVDLGDETLVEAVAELRLICAECGRMIRKRDEAVRLLHEVLDGLDERRHKARVQSIYLTLAMTYDSMNSSEEALSAAQRVCSLAHRESHDYLQARAIILEHEKSGDELERSLKRLETRCRNLGHKTVANNISLTRARLSDNTDEILGHLSHILSSDGTDYNKVRAYVRRVNELLDSGREADITDVDKRWLERGYSYLFCQRMSSLFDQCHNALWRIVSTENDVASLLRLFRHSSFLWRLRGEAAQERDCLNELFAVVDDVESTVETAKKSVGFEFNYVVIRRSALVIEEK